MASKSRISLGSYVIAEESFATKNLLTQRCQAILEATPNGSPVKEDSAQFLFSLFLFHDEWLEKAEGGVRDISTQVTGHGTRCFVLRKLNGDQIDISFPHAIRLIPNARTTSLLPQALRDFRSAARTAVRTQTFRFRDSQLTESLNCPITGELLSQTNCAVDHTPPNTFDKLLFDFCKMRRLNPLKITILSEGGTVAKFENETLSLDWQDFHRQHADLRLMSKIGNLQLPRVVINWSELWSYEP